MSAARRLAFVSPRFAQGPAIGGAETLLRALAARAQAAGREVAFLTTCATDHVSWRNVVPEGRRTIDGLPVHFFPVNANRDEARFLRLQDRIGRGRCLSETEEAEWLRNNVNSDALAAWLSANAANLDRVVAGPYLFGVIHQAARVLPDRALLLPCLHDEPFARLQATRRLFGQVRGFLFNSEPEQALAVRLFGLPPDAGHVVGIGMDARPPADPSAFAARSGIRAPYLMYAGRREPLKGTPLLVDYFAAYRKRTGRDIHLVLAGSGAVDIPRDLKPYVLDAGFLTEREKNEAMAGAVAFCHPSVNESLSIVLLESWINETPTLVHAGSEVMRFLCRRSNGGLWFGSYPEFEESLSLLLDRPDTRREMGQLGRSYVQREYAWPAVEQRLLGALDA
jgi:glycosyltransferase involved in cell wall biosynthesis